MKVRGILTAAGPPTPCEEQLPFSLGRKTFALRIADNSFRPFSISQSDFLICKVQKYYEDGQLVFCSVPPESSFEIAPCYLGYYKQIGQLIIIELPFGELLLPPVVVEAAVVQVIRTFL